MRSARLVRASFKECRRSRDSSCRKAAPRTPRCSLPVTSRSRRRQILEASDACTILSSNPCQRVGFEGSENSSFGTVSETG